MTGISTPNDDIWNEQISFAEKLLIYAHKPPHNAKEIKWLSEESDRVLREVHLLNKGSYKNLFPEVSGIRLTVKYDEEPDPNYMFYGKHKNKK